MALETNLANIEKYSCDNSTIILKNFTEHGTTMEVEGIILTRKYMSCRQDAYIGLVSQLTPREFQMHSVAY